MMKHWKKLLLLVPLLLVLCTAAQGGWIEDRPDGTTVIHLKLFNLPDPTRMKALMRCELDDQVFEGRDHT
jgi:hypothetical protein